jgi:hypothetical protein
MKLAAPVLMLLASAGLAVLALTTRRPVENASRSAPTVTESDAWFV